jgi:minor histocompatibility antigen H13
MLGLGDIVVPGIFISLCIKYDVDKCLKGQKPAKPSDVKTSYFNISFIGYVLGIV